MDTASVGGTGQLCLERLFRISLREVVPLHVSTATGQLSLHTRLFMCFLCTMCFTGLCVLVPTSPPPHSLVMAEGIDLAVKPRMLPRGEIDRLAPLSPWLYEDTKIVLIRIPPTMWQ